MDHGILKTGVSGGEPYPFKQGPAVQLAPGSAGQLHHIQPPGAGVARFCVLLHRTAGVGFGKTSYSGGGSSDTAVMWQVGFRPGIKIEICEHVNIESHIGFLGYKGVNNAGRADRYHYENGWGLRFSSENITIGACYEF